MSEQRIAEVLDELRKVSALKWNRVTLVGQTLDLTIAHIDYLQQRVQALENAGALALAEMVNTVAPRNSFTNAVDALDAALSASPAETGRASETSAIAQPPDAVAMLRMLYMECIDEGHTDSGEPGDACRHRGMVIRCGICSTLDDVKKVLDAIPAPPPSASSATTTEQE